MQADNRTNHPFGTSLSTASPPPFAQSSFSQHGNTNTNTNTTNKSTNNNDNNSTEDWFHFDNQSFTTNSAGGYGHGAAAAAAAIAAGGGGRLNDYPATNFNAYAFPSIASGSNNSTVPLSTVVIPAQTIPSSSSTTNGFNYDTNRNETHNNHYTTQPYYESKSPSSSTRDPFFGRNAISPSYSQPTQTYGQYGHSATAAVSGGTRANAHHHHYHNDLSSPNSSSYTAAASLASAPPAMEHSVSVEHSAIVSNPYSSMVVSQYPTNPYQIDTALFQPPPRDHHADHHQPQNNYSTTTNAVFDPFSSSILSAPPPSTITTTSSPPPIVHATVVVPAPAAPYYANANANSSYSNAHTYQEPTKRMQQLHDMLEEDPLEAFGGTPSPSLLHSNHHHNNDMPRNVVASSSSSTRHKRTNSYKGSNSSNNSSSRALVVTTGSNNYDHDHKKKNAEEKMIQHHTAPPQYYFGQRSNEASHPAPNEATMTPQTMIRNPYRDDIARRAPPGASPLPKADWVKNRGYVLARISFRTIVMKKWKQTFWAQYGPHTMLWFRNEQDFSDWLNNPYHDQAQRNFLIKMAVNFVHDLYKPNVRGYQVTQCRTKAYGDKMIRQFKLERWMDYGPTIAAAFGSYNPKEVDDLREALVECMRNTPLNSGIRATGAVRQNRRARDDDSDDPEDEEDSKTSRDGDDASASSVGHRSSSVRNKVTQKSPSSDEPIRRNNGRKSSDGMAVEQPPQQSRDLMDMDAWNDVQPNHEQLQQPHSMDASTQNAPPFGHIGTPTSPQRQLNSAPEYIHPAHGAQQHTESSWNAAQQHQLPFAQPPPLYAQQPYTQQHQQSFAQPSYAQPQQFPQPLPSTNPFQSNPNNYGAF